MFPLAWLHFSKKSEVSTISVYSHLNNFLPHRQTSFKLDSTVKTQNLTPGESLHSRQSLDELVPKFHLYCLEGLFWSIGLLYHERERCVTKTVYTVHTSSPRFLTAWVSLIFTQNDALTCPYSFV